MHAETCVAKTGSAAGVRSVAVSSRGFLERKFFSGRARKRAPLRSTPLVELSLGPAVKSG